MMMMNSDVYVLAGLFLFFVGILEVYQESTDVIVTTDNGRIRGTMVQFDGISVRQFLGIPFAEPPIRQRRFLAPDPAPPWKPDIYNATSFKAACMQDAAQKNDVNELEPLEEIEYSEDCLYLNVFSPAINASEESDLIPVLVFIHGGEYSYGSAHGYLGYPLATRGVVVVTIQYRLGPFGFLSTIDPTVAGNAGMLDQIMALKWVQKHIQSFHGDPDSVTLFGRNSGATSACLHMLSPLSQGLFDQVIAIGGVADTPWAVKNWTMSAYYSSILMRYVGCKDDEEGNILEELDCVRQKNTSQLLEFSKKAVYISDTLPWFPVIGGPSAFLPRDLATLANEPHYAKNINVMIGLSKNEGQYLFEREMKTHHPDGGRVLNYLNATIHDSVIKLFLSRRINFNRDAIYSITKHKYTYWPRLRDEEMFRQQLIELYTDYNFVAPMTKLLQRQSLYSPSYMYVFDYHPDPINPGAKQGAELRYIFGLPFIENDLRKSPKRDKDKGVIEYRPSTEDGTVNSGKSHDGAVLPDLPGEGEIEFVPLEGSGESTAPPTTTKSPVEIDQDLPLSSATKRTSVVRPTVLTPVDKVPLDLNMTDTTFNDSRKNMTGGRGKRAAKGSVAADRRMSLFMMKLWTNFVKYGYPTVEEDDNTSWVPYYPHQWNYALIKQPVILMQHNYRHDKVSLWNVYLPKLTIIPNDLPQDPLKFEFDVYQAVMWSLLMLVLSLLAIIYYMGRAALKRRKQPSRFADQSRYLTLSMQRMA